MDEQQKKAVSGSILRLAEHMEKLRAPGGCPWDREQTHQTLKKYMIEEAHEACEAIDQGDDRKICEELGDVLLQVVFHGQMASERGAFTLADIADAISEKLVERHPHVFGDMDLSTSEEVLQNWEQMKAEREESRSSLLDGIPASLPALLRSRRIQERAAQVGFDWNHIGEVIDKMMEEVGEFRAECRDRDPERLEDELGDLLFAIVNVSRYLNIDPEAALHRTARKFIERFRHIEKRVAESGRSLDEVSLEEMDGYWDEAKTSSRDGDPGDGADPPHPHTRKEPHP
jgi:tetrapyrrole methylase family protein/MazG family protein